MYKPVIMIIDENENHRSMIKKIIEPVNAGIVEEASGSEGLSAVFQSKPDLVIANIRAFRLDGLELCRRMKGDVSTQNIPVVLVGSNEKDDHIGLGFKAGANAYIEKKEAKTKLLRNVTTLLKQTKSKCEKLILVVDDSSSIRELLLDGLTKEGYRVITAENGKKALVLLQTNHPDLILSDVYMPEMNGLALCETLHSDPYLSTIPFVVMSTENDAGNMKRMMQYGAASFIVKPFNIEQLILVLEKIFSFQFLILLKEKERLESEQNLLIASIASLANALEARDEYTRGHSERVASILAGLVKRFGGSQAEIDRALIAGKLHDIGKIGIRDNVLLKPGRLTEEEFNHIKQHSMIGANILKSIPSIADIIPVVASHHERIDGKGYPKGLSGDQIPLWARMTAVADTYDALTSDRPYRKGMPVAKALQIIRDVKGTQLCPDCVDLFITWSEQEDI